jgi:ABC-type branched-subunit amino acid transport system permease subunit
MGLNPIASISALKCAICRGIDLCISLQVSAFFAVGGYLLATLKKQEEQYIQEMYQSAQVW